MTKVRSELDPSSRFDKTPTCDRRTHRQTQGNSKYRAVKIIVTTRARDLAINDIKTTVHLADYGRHRSHVFRGNHLPSHERSVCQSLLAIFLLRRLHHATFHHFGTDLGYCRNCYLGRLKSINQSMILFIHKLSEESQEDATGGKGHTSTRLERDLQLELRDVILCHCYDSNYKKLSYRRGTARCVVSLEILPIATQQCRNYLYDKS